MSNKTAKTANTATANNAKTNTVLNMTELIELSHKNGVCYFASSNKSTQYRIFNGKSSIHIQKTQYKVFATDTDLMLFGELDTDKRTFKQTAKIDGITCECDTNTTDGVRPNIIYVKPFAIEKFIKQLAMNKLNCMQ